MWQPQDSHQELAIDTWSAFDAGSAKSLVKLQRLFTSLALLLC
jgi:hypothetical protein